MCAKASSTKDFAGNTACEEHVLDAIVERKCYSDLHGSVCDNKDRFNEQRFRLKNSGISSIFYIVEGVLQCALEFCDLKVVLANRGFIWIPGLLEERFLRRRHRSA